MRMFDGTAYRDMTPEEVTAMERMSAIAAIEATRRPLTMEEVSRMVIAQQINSLEADDHTALRMEAFYPQWAVGTTWAAGDRARRDGRLWKCLQAHTAQPGWEPEQTSALWTEVCEIHSGTAEDPIPYSGNMALEEGTYYWQDGARYRCIRATGQPVHQSLADLTGLFTEPA